YLAKYPDGQFAELAKSRSQAARPASGGGSDSVEMIYWNTIKDSKNPADFKAYVTKFPGGLFVELANARISSLEAEANERDRAKANAAAEERARNTHLFDVLDEGRTRGTLTVAPGSVSFEARNQKNDKKNITYQCTEIRRVEQGQSAFQPPHINLVITGRGKKDEEVTFYTSSGGQGLFAPKPVVDVTTEVLNAVIDACKMSRINK